MVILVMMVVVIVVFMGSESSLRWRIDVLSICKRWRYALVASFDFF